MRDVSIRDVIALGVHKPQIVPRARKLWNETVALGVNESVILFLIFSKRAKLARQSLEPGIPPKENIPRPAINYWTLFLPPTKKNNWKSLRKKREGRNPRETLGMQSWDEVTTSATAGRFQRRCVNLLSLIKIFAHCSNWGSGAFVKFLGWLMDLTSTTVFPGSRHFSWFSWETFATRGMGGDFFSIARTELMKFAYLWENWFFERTFSSDFISEIDFQSYRGLLNWIGILYFFKSLRWNWYSSYIFMQSRMNLVLIIMTRLNNR